MAGNGANGGNGIGRQQYANKVPRPPRHAPASRHSSARPPGHGGKRTVQKPRHK